MIHLVSAQRGVIEEFRISREVNLPPQMLNGFPHPVQYFHPQQYLHPFEYKHAFGDLHTYYHGNDDPHADGNWNNNAVSDPRLSLVLFYQEHIYPLNLWWFICAACQHYDQECKRAGYIYPEPEFHLGCLRCNCSYPAAQPNPVWWRQPYYY